ncbi:MAG: quinone-dependent dihydroorotate dehydrogenase [Alphaproteobacteria bacterium]|nr:quinone-dependent dihydroorotate dehydrogenase [Alphaproteobacteria bacterium]
MLDLYALARPLLFQLAPETAHGLSILAMKTGLMPGCKGVQNAALEQTLWGLKFPNPVGLAAGFDKNAEVIGPCFKLGFGFVEAGTVTPKAQGGNPRPRIFRCPEREAVINRMGFPNQGMQAFKANLEAFLGRKHRPAGVLGINIGMNKTQSEPVKDYAALIQMLGPMADYLTINISSPNTPGLRDLQKRGVLLEMLGELKEVRRKSCGEHPPPLLVKFAPDLDEAQQEELASAALEGGVDGLILTNTTLARPDDLPGAFAAEKGGLSGQPLTDKSTQVIHNFYALTKGQIPIIGVGGVSSGAQAYEKIKAGASLVQLYSSLVYQGPFVAQSINSELLSLLQQDGLRHIGEAVGMAHDKG